jgi:hypothetical protein
MEILAAASTILAFPILWCFVSWAISRLGGWSRWAEVYGDPREPTGKLFRMQSGAFSLARYRATLNLSAEPDGLALWVILPFRYGHDPLRVPWSELTVTIKGSRWYGDLAYLSVKQVPGVELQLSARTWQKLQAEAADAPAGSPETV